MLDVPTPASTHPRAAERALHLQRRAAAQNRGTQIVQRLPPPFSRGAGDMAIWIGPRLPRVEREGWIFVAGSAFVAVRPAFGGYAADPATPSYRLLDQRSPVIIQAATRADHASFEAFQGAVLAAPFRADAQEVRFEGLDGAAALAPSWTATGRRRSMASPSSRPPAGCCTAPSCGKRSAAARWRSPKARGNWSSASTDLAFARGSAPVHACPSGVLMVSIARQEARVSAAAETLKLLTIRRR